MRTQREVDEANINQQIGNTVEGIRATDLGQSLQTETAMSTNESEIREILERRTDAQQSKDIDRLLSFYSPDIVYYDAVPPLRFAGTEEVRRNFLRWFDGYKGPISLETHELTIVTSEDAAFANMLHLDSGERKGLAGPLSSIWVRETVCFRRSNDGWVITHEHISIPFDPMSFAKSYLLGLLQHVGRRAKPGSADGLVV